MQPPWLISCPTTLLTGMLGMGNKLLTEVRHFVLNASKFPVKGFLSAGWGWRVWSPSACSGGMMLGVNVKHWLQHRMKGLRLGFSCLLFGLPPFGCFHSLLFSASPTCGILCLISPSPAPPATPTSDSSPVLTGSTPLSSLIYTGEPNDLP